MWADEFSNFGLGRPVNATLHIGELVKENNKTIDKLALDK